MNLNLIGGQDRIEGWKAIAGELGVSEKRARELADPRRKLSLPVRYGARGAYIVREVLAMWFAHYDAPYGMHQELKRSGRREAEELRIGAKRVKRLKTVGQTRA